MRGKRLWCGFLLGLLMFGPTAHAQDLELACSVLAASVEQKGVNVGNVPLIVGEGGAGLTPLKTFSLKIDAKKKTVMWPTGDQLNLQVMDALFIMEKKDGPLPMRVVIDRRTGAYHSRSGSVDGNGQPVITHQEFGVCGDASKVLGK